MTNDFTDAFQTNSGGLTLWPGMRTVVTGLESSWYIMVRSSSGRSKEGKGARHRGQQKCESTISFLKLLYKDKRDQGAYATALEQSQTSFVHDLKKR